MIRTRFIQGSIFDDYTKRPKPRDRHNARTFLVELIAASVGINVGFWLVVAAFKGVI